MHNIELVVFDMAGTTVNEDNVVYKTLQKAINNTGRNLTLDFVLKHGAGKEKYQAIKDILKEEDGHHHDDKATVLFENFKTLLKKAYEDLEVTTYTGVEDLIDFLKKENIKIALNTGYDKNTAQFLIDKMKWKLGVQFDALVTADDVKKGRPNPDMIFEAMKILQIDSPEKVIKAGDSIIDIEEGKNANCGMTIGVTTGAHTRKQLASASPTYVLDALLELKDILSK